MVATPACGYSRGMQPETAELEADVSETREKVGQLTRLLEVANVLDGAARELETHTRQ